MIQMGVLFTAMNATYSMKLIVWQFSEKLV